MNFFSRAFSQGQTGKGKQIKFNLGPMKNKWMPEFLKHKSSRKTIEYGQELPQSQLTDQPWGPQGRDTEHKQIHYSNNWEPYSHTILF